MTTVTIPTARVFQPLLEPSRYKGAWGGRGGGKSHFFGELLVERCAGQWQRDGYIKQGKIVRILRDPTIKVS